jgi:hypothetical protein
MFLKRAVPIAVIVGYGLKSGEERAIGFYGIIAAAVVYMALGEFASWIEERGFPEQAAGEIRFARNIGIVAFLIQMASESGLLGAHPPLRIGFSVFVALSQIFKMRIISEAPNFDLAGYKKFRRENIVDVKNKNGVAAVAALNLSFWQLAVIAALGVVYIFGEDAQALWARLLLVACVVAADRLLLDSCSFLSAFCGLERFGRWRPALDLLLIPANALILSLAFGWFPLSVESGGILGIVSLACLFSIGRRRKEAR